MRNTFIALAAAVALVTSAAPAFASQTAGIMLASIGHEEIGLSQIKHTSAQIVEIGDADYTDMDSKMRRTGNVVVAVELSASGAVVSTTLKKSSGFRSLDNSAIATVGQAKYQAETLAGKAVGGTYAVTVAFPLEVNN
jgi:TonB family protein